MPETVTLLGAGKAQPLTTARLREIMASLGVDKKQLADQLGDSVRTVEGWLQGKKVGRITGRAIEQMAGGKK